MNNIAKLCIVLFLMAMAAGCSDRSSDQTAIADSGVSLRSELGGSADGYERACGPREFSFPADHGAHPAFRNEWWYVTGNVESASSRRFGFHVTFFRIAQRPVSETAEIKPADKSAWTASEFYMAHFGITESTADQVRVHERFSRAAAGLAGAQSGRTVDEAVRVWLDDWSLQAVEQNGHLVWKLSLVEGADEIDLVLRANKPVVLQGDGGFSQKSADPCNASFYYSLSRMDVTGKLSTDGFTHDVEGSAWLDREWSSSVLGDDQVGWDWFSLQLNDGRDIMFYLLRKNDGSADRFSYAVEIDPQGKKHKIPVSMLDITIEQWWQSQTGGRYPVAGKITRRDTQEIINFKPLIENQELNLAVRYWEGSIELTDHQGHAIGHGYLELTGY